MPCVQSECDWLECVHSYVKLHPYSLNALDLGGIAALYEKKMC